MNQILPVRDAQQQSQLSSDMSTIMDMGFTEEEAQNALIINSNNVAQAVNYLLQAPPPAQHTSGQDEEKHLQRALEESMLTVNASYETNSETKKPLRRTAQPKSLAKSIPITTNRAGQAALERLEKQNQNKFQTNKKNMPPDGTSATTANRSATTSRTPKAPQPLASKSKEEQVLRSVTRMSPYPKAIDTMLHALRMLQKTPSANSKYRIIDKSTLGYQQAFENVPGATDLFRVLNFDHLSDKWVLSRTLDKALLWMAVSSLEQVRATNPDYQRAKRKLEFIRHVQLLLNEEKNSDEEVRGRASHRNHCPPEPSVGAVQTIIVSIVLAANPNRKKQEEEYDVINNNTNSTKTILSRRFNSDDTMGDVLHWLGERATEIPNKLQQREWCLRDKNRYPSLPIRCSTEADLTKTLHAAGCWPTGHLELDLSDDEWREREQ